MESISCIFGCDINENGEFYNFPNDSMLCNQWLLVCGFNRNEVDTQKVFICGQHFDNSCFNVVNNTRTLINNAVPSIFYPHLQNQIDTSENEIEEMKTDFTKDKIISKTKLKALEMAKKSFELSLEKIENENIKLNNKLKKLRHQKTMLSNSQIAPAEERQLLEKVLTKSQIKILRTGISRTRWTDEEMTLGYMLKQLGNNKGYNYLNKNLKIPLPGISSIRHWINDGLKMQESQSQNDGKPGGSSS